MRRLISLFFIFFFVCLFLCTCSQSSKHSDMQRNEAPAEMAASEIGETEYEAAQENNLKSKERVSNVQEDKNIKKSEEGYTSSAAAVENPNLTDKKFIRIAELNFKVKDVISTTYQLEDIVVGLGGFVEKSEIRSEETYGGYSRHISADSVIEISKYTLRSNLKLRIPSNNLDSALKSIAPLVDKMDYRIISADDVSLSILENRLSRIRQQETDKRLSQAIDDKGRKLDDITDAEMMRQRTKEAADRALLSNLKLSDRITYSTIQISIYQNEITKAEIKAREKYIEEYRPSFGSRLVEGFSNGWDIVKEIIIFFSNIWFLLVLVIVAYIVYYRIRKKKKE